MSGIVRTCIDEPAESIKRPPAWQFIAAMLPVMDFSDDVDKVEQVLATCYVRHLIFRDSVLRQALVFAHPVADLKSNTDTPLRRGAKIYLQLTDGQVYGVQLFDNIERGLVRLEEMAGYLSRCNYDPSLFFAYETELSLLIHSELDSDISPHCSIRLFRNAPYTVQPSFFTSVLNNVTIALLGLLKGKYHRDKVKLCLDQVTTYFDNLAAEENMAANFNQGLDSSIVEQINQLGRSFNANFGSLHSYNFLIAGDGMLSRNRCQAMEQLPWLFPIVVPPYDDKWRFSKLSDNSSTPKGPEKNFANAERSDFPTSVTAAIDQGLPLFEFIADSFATTREIIRWTRHQAFQSMEIFSREDLNVLLPLLAHFPTEKRPQTPAQFTLFERLLSKLTLFIQPYLSAEDSPGVWFSERHRIIDLLSVPKVHAFVSTTLTELKAMKLDCRTAFVYCFNEMESAKDYLLALGNAMKLTKYGYLDERNQIADEATTMLLDYVTGHSIRHIVRNSQTWHNLIDNELEKLILGAAPDRKAEWPLVLTEPLHVNNYIISELTNEYELIVEGNQLRHCIGTYGAQCSHGRSLVFSVRNMAGKKFSTLELTIGSVNPQIKIKSHHAYGNSMPGEACQKVVNELVDVLNTSKYVGRIEMRRQFQQKNKHAQDIARQLNNEKKREYVQIIARIAWQCEFGRH